jgi:membrane DNA delivery protein
MPHFWEAIVTIFAAAATVAIVAVIVSRNSQSPAVIQAGGSALSNLLDVAVSPVTMNTSPPNLSYPGAGIQGMLPIMGGSPVL